MLKPKGNHIDDALHGIISAEQARAIGSLLSEVTEGEISKDLADNGIEDIKQNNNPAVLIDKTNERGDRLRALFHRKKDETTED